jgi:uncharacterized protein YndB with AHSA1/START domain
MTKPMQMDAYGVLTEPATLTIRRVLPGPIERIWSYLTDSELRRKWLAAGDMQGKAGTAFEFVWRNGELSDPPSPRPDGFPEEHRLESQVTEFDPPHRLAFTWGRSGGVTIELKPQGSDVLLTLVHHRLPDRDTLIKVAAGWHAHLDVLLARASGKQPAPFWERWSRLRDEYDERIPSCAE